MNAKKIVENVFLKSNDNLVLVGVKELLFIHRKNVRSYYLYMGKMFICLDLECFFLYSARVIGN